MFEHILVPLDGSPLAEGVLPHAVAVACAFDSEVMLLQVLDESMAGARSIFPDLAQWYLGEVEAKSYLNKWTDRLCAAGVRTTNAVLKGRAAGRIVEFAHDHDVSLILLNSHGQSGRSKWNVGSVVQKIFLRAGTSVMVARASQPVETTLTGLHYQRVMAPLDCSQRAEFVLPFAAAMAHTHGAELLLAHVVNKPEVLRRNPLSPDISKLINQLTEHNRNQAARHLEELRSGLSANVQTRLLIGDNAPETLHELVARENVDLVILGAHGYGYGARWPYGSTALNFIAFGSTPLLLVQDLSMDKIDWTQAELATRAYQEELLHVQRENSTELDSVEMLGRSAKQYF